MKKLKVGMMSFAHGHAGFFLHWLSQRPDVEVTGIYDELSERVQGTVAHYGMAYFTDYETLLASDIDAVVICSENARHAEMTIAAATAGKHVLCEKPLGLAGEEMQAMIEACSQNGVQLMTAFPCRFAPAVQAAKHKLELGELGEIVAVKGYNRGLRGEGWFVDPALSGGGAVIDHTVHVMDLMHWFLDARVSSVYAEVGKLFVPDGEVDDAAMIHLTFDNGIIGVLDPSWSRSASYPTWGDVRLEIIGTAGVLEVDALADKVHLYSNDAAKSQWVNWGVDINQALIDAWVDALLSGTPVPVNGEDGLAAAEVALAAYASAERKVPVSIGGEA